MAKRSRWAAWLLVLPLAVLPAACGDDADERAALREDEIERELDLALQGDTLPGTFQDTVVGVVPEPEPGLSPVWSSRGRRRRGAGSAPAGGAGSYARSAAGTAAPACGRHGVGPHGHEHVAAAERDAVHGEQPGG
jgi:hypothetical protein